MNESEQVLQVPSAPSDLTIGEYVFASRWGDADWCDPWGVGHVCEIGETWVRLAETGARRFPKAMRISHEVGATVVAEYPSLEKASVDLDYARVAKIFQVGTSPTTGLGLAAEVARLRGALVEAHGFIQNVVSVAEPELLEHLSEYKTVERLCADALK